MENPVRIYVLYHPESVGSASDGKPSVVKDLTDRIYDWFRLPSLDGIPVYVRSRPLLPELDPDGLRAREPQDRPSLPYGMKAGTPVLEYIVPLVDAHMVRDPAWHDYLVDLAERCDASAKGEQPGFRGVMFPVALDPTAFNMPSAISRRNYIRHGMESDGGAGNHRPPTEDAEETLKHLTEALARDLDRQIFRHESRSNTRFRIFISYARSDGSEIAKALRNYIQSQTQCLAFLDENDIGYGQPFDMSLQTNVDDLARAMIVVNTDSYADRTWCRWEIDRFTRPHKIGGQRLVLNRQDSCVHFFHPLLVVDAVNGARMTRVIPEMAQAPMIRWDERRARLCFSSLMREVVLGLRAVRVAQQELEQDRTSQKSILVNRLPGPVAIDRLLREHRTSAGPHAPTTCTIRYPGNGMSLIELRLLQKMFGETSPCVRFRAFQDLLPEAKEQGRPRNQALARMRKALEAVEKRGADTLPLRNKVIAISTSYCNDDLASIGALEQHQDEALIHLLRPLLRLGADLSYGGNPPTTASDSQPSATRNITSALLRLVSEERPEEQAGANHKQGPRPRGPLLFNVCAWPRYDQVSAQDEAAWINSYRILRFTPERARLPPWEGPIPRKDEAPPLGYRRYVARVTSAIRAQQGKGYEFRLPGGQQYKMRPAVFVFLGGRLSGFSGIMPGIMEEFLLATKTRKPIFLFGGLGGASGVLARALCTRGKMTRPKELTLDFYRNQPVLRKHEDFNSLLQELKSGDPKPRQRFDELWSLIQEHRHGNLGRLFNNGLSDDENRHLIRTLNTSEAVSLAWQGISRKIL